MANNQQKRGTVSFTPEIDKRIIDGFLGDREAMLKELAWALLKNSSSNAI